MINQRINSPFPYWRILKLPSDHSLDKALVAIYKEITAIIEQCKTRLKIQTDLAKQPSNFLEAMLIAQQSEEIEFSDEEIFSNTSNDVTSRRRYNCYYSGLDDTFYGRIPRSPE